MPKARIAVLWRPGRNIELQERFLDASLTDDSLQEAHYIMLALHDGGFDTKLVKWEHGRPDLVFEEIDAFKPHLIFNASSEEEVCFCEAAKIPFAGSGIDLVPLDKATRKKIWLYHGIPTPAFMTVSSLRSLENVEAMLERHGLHYPLFVKPVKGRGSSGITDSSIVRDEVALREACARIINRMKQPALVERYIRGREISVGLIGNDDDLQVLPTLEVKYRSARTNTFQHKMNDMEILECPAKLKETLRKHIEDTARKAFSVLGARDYARIDLMLEPEREEIYLLELNTFPGLTLPLQHQNDPDQAVPSGLAPERNLRTLDSFRRNAPRMAHSAAVHVSYMGKMAEALGRTGAWLVCSIAEAALKRYRVWHRSFHVA